MIKGVNRQVLEIHETGTEYFEKALFFVKPEYSTLSEKRLNDKAMSALSGTGKIPVTRHAKIRSVLFRIAGLISAAGIGAAVSFFIRL